MDAPNRLTAMGFLVLGVMSSTQAPAQPNRSSPPAVVAVRAGRILDVRSGNYFLDQLIVIEGDRITQVGGAKEISRVLPRGVDVIDLSRATVLPGLIDAHTHLTNTVETTAAVARSGPPTPGPSGLARAALRAVPGARATLEAGFTTVRDAGSAPFVDVALRDAIDAGDVIGPRLLACGRAMTGLQKQTVDELTTTVRENIRNGADFIKFFASGGLLLGSDTSRSPYSLDEMRAIVGAAHAGGRKAAAHAHGAVGIRDAVLAGADSIEHGSSIDEETIQLMKQRGTYLVPTIYVHEWSVANDEALGFPAIYMVNLRRVTAERSDRCVALSRRV